MALVNLSEAARLTQKSRMTLHRHIKAGKLSVVRDRDGLPQVDTSELIRVYGELKRNVTQKDAVVVQRDTPHIQDELAALKEEITLIRVELKNSVSSIGELKETIKNLTLRLEHKAAIQIPVETETQVLSGRAEDDPEWPKTITSTADITLRNEIRERYNNKKEPH